MFLRKCHAIKQNQYIKKMTLNRVNSIAYLNFTYYLVDLTQFFQFSKLPGRTAVISKICTWFTKAYSGSSDINSIQKLVRGESFSA